MKASNVKAMREALIKAITMLAFCEWPDGTNMEGVEEVMRDIDSALDAPPRNCDVGTAKEQEVRFKSFCESHWDLNKPDSECAGCPLDEKRVGTECEFAWLQMPYTDGEAK